MESDHSAVYIGLGSRSLKRRSRSPTIAKFETSRTELRESLNLFLSLVGYKPKPAKTLLPNYKYQLLFFLGLLLHLTHPYLSYSQHFNFERIPNELGLSQNLISAIAQDEQGFLWVGTKDGLSRFDGFQFKVFRHLPGDSSSISDDHIKSLFIDAQKRFWIATSSGLDLYNPSKESFYHILSLGATKSETTAPLLKSEINHITQDRDGAFWLSTRGSGLYRMRCSADQYQAEMSEFRNFRLEHGLLSENVKYVLGDGAGLLWVKMQEGCQTLRYDSKNGAYEIRNFSFSNFASHWQEKVEGLRYFNKNQWLPEDRIFGMIRGEDGTIWMVTAPGLVQWTPQTNRFSYFSVKAFLADYPVFANSLEQGAGFLDQNGRLWFGSLNALLVFDTQETSEAQTDYPLALAWHTKMNDLPGDLHPAIASLYEDKSGVVWLGSNGLGLFKYHSNNQRFVHHQLEAIAPSIPSIRAICESDDGAVWIATSSYRFFQFNRETRQINFVKINQIDRPRYEGYALSIYPDSRGNLWVDNITGVTRLTLKDGTVAKQTNFTLLSEEGNPLKIYDIQEGLDGRVWFISQNTFGWIDQASGIFNGQPYLPPSIDGNNIRNFPCIHPNMDGTFWLGTVDGLKHYDPQTKQFTSYRNDPADHNSLSSNIIRSILADPSQPEQVLWIGTAGGGLNRFDISSEKWERFGLEEGLPDKVIYGILDDSEGNLWMSTNQGLCKFDPQTGTVKTYTTADGLQDQEFNSGAYFKSKSGELFFGGLNGFNAFFPEDIKESDFEVPVVITDFKLFNKVVVIKAPESPLLQSISFSEKITLNHTDKVFSFEFAALDFTNPKKNQYAYRLKNFEEQWQYIGNQRTATFTNLDPGSYVFHVKASNHDGVWNENPTSIQIQILPPWWRSWWAYLAYLVVGFGIIRAIYRFQLRRRLEQAEAENIKQLDHFRSRFYTNITHEFRTPLTIILGMMDNIQGYDKERQLVRRNSNKLLRLINQLLDLAKLESGRLSLKLIQGDFIKYLSYLTESFHSMASEKHIQLTFESDVPELVMDFDPDKVQEVVYNLLSNALKFTPENGRVQLQVLSFERREPPYLQINVKDNGIGISSNQLPYIFDRFYQADDASVHQKEGTGIGLAVANELVTLMGGKIAVESQAQNGTLFMVYLPINRNPKTPKREASDKQSAFQKLKAHQSLSGTSFKVNDGPNIHESDAPLLLLIEDNADVATYIESLLQKEYRIEKAADGQTGIDRAVELIPDIIITDVMMPQKDGYEVCEALKTDERTSHIPIVMLTAKATHADRLTGLKTGADAYLTKPFNKDELFIRLEKLVALRQALQKRYAHAIGPLGILGVPKNQASLEPTLDDLFLEKIRKVIDEKIGDTDLDIPYLCQVVHLSATQLFRKMKALTGEAPISFIRKVRLHKARELVETTDLSIAEIAYDMGFTDPAYFSRAFSKEFGNPPSYFRNQ